MMYKFIAVILVSIFCFGCTANRELLKENELISIENNNLKLELRIKENDMESLTIENNKLKEKLEAIQNSPERLLAEAMQAIKDKDGDEAKAIILIIQDNNPTVKVLKESNNLMKQAEKLIIKEQFADAIQSIKEKDGDEAKQIILKIQKNQLTTKVLKKSNYLLKQANKLIVEEEKREKMRILKEQLAQRKKEQQEALELHMSKSHDKLDNETWYSPKEHDSMFYPYIYIGDEQEPELNIKIDYFYSNILIVDDCYAYIDGEMHNLSASFRRKSYDSSSQTAYRTADIDILKAIEKSDETILRFVGTSGLNTRKTQDDHTLSYEAKRGIRHTLDAYELLKKK